MPVAQGEAGRPQAGELGVDGVDAGDLDAQVVEGAAGARVLDEDELERRLGHGEVGVAGLALGRLRAEQAAVEVDRRLEVVDVEGELDAGHGVSST